EIALAIEVFDDRFVAIDSHGGDCRREPMRFAAMGGRQQKDARTIGVLQAAEAHELALPGQGGNRETIGQRLAEAGKIRIDTIEMLRTVPVPAETGDHFIEDEQSPVFMADA